MSEELHRQYILSFEPKSAEAKDAQHGTFHTVRVEVADRPELDAKTRDGYWALP